MRGRKVLTAMALIFSASCQPAKPPTTSAPAAESATEVPGPVTDARITESYARMVARDAYFWAWPMVNLYNRRLAFKQVPSPGLMNGVLPGAPLNHLCMLSDYIKPEQRWVACPNQDVVYGAGLATLEEGPVVIQVPDFGTRFWVYQLVDLRTDSFADIGAMYGTKPGFYLVVGPEWKGDPPQGIAQVLRAKTNTVFVGPRVFQDDTPEDKRAVQAVLAGIAMYPLSEFDGKVKQHDWTNLPTFGTAESSSGGAETKWVFPDTFFEQLPLVLADAPPLPGEAARYAQALALVAAVQNDPALKKAAIDEVTRAEREMVQPLLQFRNWGEPLHHHWSTVSNGAAFGSDYFARTAVAKSNILVNKANETKYCYQDLDSLGHRLNGSHRYTVTYSPPPPVKGFWSLTLYDEHHFFVPNEIHRYSVGTKYKDLRQNPDGSLTIHVQSSPPTDPAQRANWLPSPRGKDFTLYQRAYWPEEAVVNGLWMPPAVVRAR